MNLFRLMIVYTALIGMVHQVPAQVGLFDESGDIGIPAVEGTTEFDAQTGTYTVTGSGDDIWGTADNFQFVWKEVSGDVNMIGRVILDEGTSTSGWAKAGLMLRDDLTPESAHAYALVTSARNDYLPHWREFGGLESGFIGFDNQAGGSGPDGDGTHDGKIEIERRNEVDIQFYYYDPETGERILLGLGFADLVDPIYVGLAVTARDDGNICTGTFSELQLFVDGVEIEGPVDVENWAIYE